MTELTFDVVFHLAGAQVIPNYMGIKACECLRHVIVVTDRTEKQRARLQSVLGMSEEAIQPLSVPAYDYPEIVRRLNERIAAFEGKRIGFNITGGTKPMSTAALDVCRAKGLTPFYVDTETRKILWFTPPYDERPLPQFFSETNQFIALAGENVGLPGKTYEEAIDMSRRRLVNDFWGNRGAVRTSINNFAQASDEKLKHWGNPPNEYWNGRDQLMGWADRSCPMLAQHWAAVFPDERTWREAALFGGGGWFEEYALMALHNAENVLDARWGKKVTILDTDKNEKLLQDLDISYTTGYELVILECKAGNVKQEHIQKLENLSQKLGGSFGRGVLVAIDPPDDVVRARIANSRLSMICGEACGQIATRLGGIAPGRVYET